jgi:hypothetical protein
MGPKRKSGSPYLLYAYAFGTLAAVGIVTVRRRLIAAAAHPIPGGVLG